MEEIKQESINSNLQQNNNTDEQQLNDSNTVQKMEISVEPNNYQQENFDQTLNQQEEEVSATLMEFESLSNPPQDSLKVETTEPMEIDNKQPNNNIEQNVNNLEKEKINEEIKKEVPVETISQTENNNVKSEQLKAESSSEAPVQPKQEEATENVQEEPTVSEVKEETVTTISPKEDDVKQESVQTASSKVAVQPKQEEVAENVKEEPTISEVKEETISEAISQTQNSTPTDDVKQESAQMDSSEVVQPKQEQATETIKEENVEQKIENNQKDDQESHPKEEFEEKNENDIKDTLMTEANPDLSTESSNEIKSEVDDSKQEDTDANSTEKEESKDESEVIPVSDDLDFSLFEKAQFFFEENNLVECIQELDRLKQEVPLHVVETWLQIQKSKVLVTADVPPEYKKQKMEELKVQKEAANLANEEPEFLAVSPTMAKKILKRNELMIKVRNALKIPLIELKEKLEFAKNTFTPGWWTPYHDRVMLKVVSQFGWLSGESNIFDNCESTFFPNENLPEDSIAKRKKGIREFFTNSPGLIHRLTYLSEYLVNPDSPELYNFDCSIDEAWIRPWRIGPETRKRRRESEEPIVEIPEEDKLLEARLPTGSLMRHNSLSNIKLIRRDAEGKPIYPIQVKGANVECLGEIIFDRPNFHSKNYIWPVGFKSTRFLPSIYDSEDKVLYTSEILDGGDGPLFRVTPEDGEAKEHKSPSTVWADMLQAIKRRSVSVSGPEMYGFSDAAVKLLIQELPNADKCKEYSFRTYENS